MELTLRNHGKSALHVLLQALVHEGVPTGENEEHDLRKSLALIANFGTSSCNSITNFLSTVLGANDRVLVLNLAAMTNVGLDEDVHEIADSLVIGASTDDNNTPGLQRLSIWEQELLATKVPAALSAWVELLTSKLDLGILEKTSCSLGKSQK